MGDKTSAVGWHYKNKLVKSALICHDAVTLVARTLASLVSASGHCLASQHFRGEDNIVFLLSFQGDDRKSEATSKAHPLATDSPSNSELTRRFQLHLPQMISLGFEISQMPDEISCFVTQAIHTAEFSWIRSKKTFTNQSSEFGVGGQNSAKPKWVLSTHSSMMHRQ